MAVTLEFSGPLAVAVLGSRRLLDGLWVALAAGGIILLAPIGAFGGLDLDPVGVGLALLAGLLGDVHHPQSEDGGGVLRRDRACDRDGGRSGSPRPGRSLSGRRRPPRLEGARARGRGRAAVERHTVLAGDGGAEEDPGKVFGVLMSLEPAVAALVGLVVLGEVLQPRAIVAVFLVTIAAIGASRFASGEKD